MPTIEYNKIARQTLDIVAYAFQCRAILNLITPNADPRSAGLALHLTEKAWRTYTRMVADEAHEPETLNNLFTSVAGYSEGCIDILLSSVTEEPATASWAA